MGLKIAQGGEKTAQLIGPMLGSMPLISEPQENCKNDFQIATNPEMTQRLATT